MSHDIRDMMLRTVDRLVAVEATRQMRSDADGGGFPDRLWQAMDAAGLTDADTIDDEMTDAADMQALVRHTARHALPVPLAEVMAARRLLKAAGMAMPADGITGIGTTARDHADGLPRLDDAGRATGMLHRVPFGRHLTRVVFAATSGDGTAHLVVAEAPAPAATDINLAGEARDDLAFDAAPVIEARPLVDAADQVMAMGAAFRAVQIAGALAGALGQVVAYAGEREQFGRPIGKFQAVQHMLAVLAAETAAASAAADLGFDDAGRTDTCRAALAKSRAGQAATDGAALAHQIMGAMGFTREHSLHYQTRRLWSWRDEFGSDALWQARLGTLVVRAGGDALWPMLSRL
ncbi:acyl-CoA dehydrogenase [Tistrella bauzanensis]|uniref:Acyl-CoA dehydrogenase n=1 Tax=Tistrella bauzanensis TaxID=657419 RepID=A0ABQ1IDM4_9PROT|nr:acyl-CoA dehydrogenase family protein [Tistrella bauzanensis]GGB36281.1 acyl-CoA dehydrogenase [Tistrella bauzanensis]